MPTSPELQKFDTDPATARTSEPVSESEGLKLAVLKRAAETIGATSPFSVTSYAARRVMECCWFTPIPRHGIAEDAGAIADLIEALRRIIRQDPDDACEWGNALRVLVDSHETLTDPRRWKPSPEQIARAREVLGGVPYQISFTEGGTMIARLRGGAFFEIPPVKAIS